METITYIIYDDYLCFFVEYFFKERSLHFWLCKIYMVLRVVIVVLSSRIVEVIILCLV